MRTLYDEIFTSMCEDQEFDDVDHLAGAFKCLVEELEFENLKCGPLGHQAVSEYLNEVDWDEIAAHYADIPDLS